MVTLEKGCFANFSRQFLRKEIKKTSVMSKTLALATQLKGNCGCDVIETLHGYCQTYFNYLPNSYIFLPNLSIFTKSLNGCDQPISPYVGFSTLIVNEPLFQ